MDNGIQFFDIILFAMIAVFLVLRLRSVLGRRDGHEGEFSNFFRQSSQEKKQETDEYNEDDNVIAIETETVNVKTEPKAKLETKTNLQTKLEEIVAADNDFDIDEFISGARIAFEYILNAYATGDANELKPLLSDEVFNNFNVSIREREMAGQTMEETLIGISKAELIEAEMEGTVVQLTVKFISDQIHALKDSNGNVVEGDPDKIVSITDFWTFTRDTRSKDPNWLLSATHSLD
ncbi:MAG: translocase [Magnetovibrio sp.]|nr:translocase [Magnetovibrio sp.]|tara:strand:- start:2305 stop:3009 length:705 start_codon:yes stop_codon:yes gene_type:complete